MKKLGIACVLAIGLAYLAGCHKVIEITPKVIDEENIVEVEDQENILEEIVEEVMEEEIIDGKKWNLLAFNGKEVDGNYNMVIANNGNLTIKFCNGIGGDINFDGEDEGTISASLFQNLVLCG